MKEIIPGIYQLPLPLPDVYLLKGNAYLVKGDEGCLLFDPGFNSDEVLNILKSQLDEIGVTMADISQIVASHNHPDHYGLVRRLKALSSAKVAIHQLDQYPMGVGGMDTDNIANLMENWMQQISQWINSHGVPTRIMFQNMAPSSEMAKLSAPFKPDITLKGDEIISIGSFNFQVIWTPGHSEGHICLYEPVKKVLLTGDHILPTISSIVTFQPQLNPDLPKPSPNPLGDYLNSINKLKELDVKLVLPGHGEPFSTLRERIDKLSNHHEQRKLEILATVKSGPKTAYDISTDLTWIPQRDDIGWEDLDPMNQMMAVLETLAHLESMIIEARARKIQSNGMTYFQAA